MCLPKEDMVDWLSENDEQITRTTVAHKVLVYGPLKRSCWDKRKAERCPEIARLMDG